MPIENLETKRDLERFVEGLLELRPSAAAVAQPPVGAVFAFPVAATPAGYLVADGTTKLRADYPALFAVYGTTFNTGGEAATEFRLPNFAGRVLAQPGGSIAALGNAGGAATHTLTTAEIPSHAHGVELTGSHVVNDPSDKASRGVTGSSPVTMSTDAAGGGGAHNNLQPYYAVNFIIRAA